MARFKPVLQLLNTWGLAMLLLFYLLSILVIFYPELILLMLAAPAPVLLCLCEATIASNDADCSAHKATGHSIIPPFSKAPKKKKKKFLDGL